MDWNALQHKLFDMDPADPAEDIRKMTQMANQAPQESAPITESAVQESVQVQEGTMPVDKDYSLNDFAKLAGVQLNEVGKDSMMRNLAKKVVGDDGVAAFDAGGKNYNKLNVLGKSADAAIDTAKGKDKSSKIPTQKSGKDDEYSKFLSQHSRKLQKISANPQRKAQFDKFMSSISEEELDEILPALAGIAGRAVAGAVANKAVDALTANKNNKKKPIKRNPVASHAQTTGSGAHKDQFKKDLPDRKQKHKKDYANESIKAQLWAALKSK